MRKLNLGCGADIREGWVNLDAAKLEGIDVVHDINRLPLPFESEEFDYILCQDVLEHVEYVPLLKDLHRILKRGGTLSIRVPHFSSKNNFIDPTHKNFFSIETFDFFAEDSAYRRDYYFDFQFKNVAYRKIVFGAGLFLNRLIEPLVNYSLKSQKQFESSFLSRLFPAENVTVRIIK